MLTRLFKDYAYRVTCLSSIFVVVVGGDVAVDVVVWAACAHALPLSSASAGDNLRAECKVCVGSRGTRERAQ